MKIGIIGAGLMAQAVGRLALEAGHHVMLSNSRGARSMVGLRESLGCEIGSVNDAAVFGEIVFAAIPLQAYWVIPPEPLTGKVVLNPQNYFSHFGRIPELESGVLTTAELLARHLPLSHVVKGLNSILVEDVMPDALPASTKERRALPIAGDNADAKAIVVKFLDQIGYDTVDAGPLAEGWRFDRRRPVYCVSLDKPMLTRMLAGTTREMLVPNGHWRFQQGIRANTKAICTDE